MYHCWKGDFVGCEVFPVSAEAGHVVTDIVVVIVPLRLLNADCYEEKKQMI